MTKRSSVTISLPEPVTKWVAEQVSEGGYDTPGAFVSDVLLRERARREKALDEEIDAALATPLAQWSEADWKRVYRAAGLVRRSSRRSRK